MKRTTAIFFLLLCIAWSATAQKKQKSPQTNILFIFDASQSMNGFWEKSKKIDLARNILIQLIDSLEHTPNVAMALRVYGHQSPVPPQDCSDTRLEVPFKLNNAGNIRQTLRYIEPKGTTPLAHSLSLAAGDFPKNSQNNRNIVILITDGIEACDGDPCKVSAALQKKGVFLKPFILGIGNNIDFKTHFNCIGKFYEVKHEEQFEKSLNYIISQVLNKTSAQVNLIDADGNPSETNVPMTFYNAVSGNVKYQLVHTINAKGNPDTLYIDPLITYNITIHTIPEIHIDSVHLIPGKHNIIGADAPQGFLKVHPMSNIMHRNLQCIVRKNHKTIHTQTAGITEKYITGKYKLEILTLPRIVIDSAIISQSRTTTVTIPKPGLATIFKPSAGVCSILVKRGQNLEKIYNLPENKLRETLTLQPGTYSVIFRSRRAVNTHASKIATFTITSGCSVPVRL